MNNRKIALSKRSTAPYYSAAATFAALCLIFTPYTLPGFLIIGAVTAVVFFAVKKLTREITVYKDRPASGVPELDDAMTALYEAIDIFTEVQPLIFSRSTEASDHLLSMKATADGMVTNLTAHPEDLKISRKFINLYLPMVVKMMKNYREMYRQGNRGDNIESSMKAIEGSLVSIDDAFRRQLDAQFANDNLDVTTDIEVLDALMGKGDVK
ncbi:MAG: 5-bromo-4-chloroindolyl phosphate hydrolysis family protein [Clostridia bacterium]|nr:5-bromo-4-chloroindolyl phosphate hydrolysis family protein [Clostridia bacterium]